MKKLLFFIFCLCYFNSVVAVSANTQKIILKPWQIIPSTPTLPKPTHSGYAPINNIKIWYAEYGNGPTVILLHGGLVNSNYWGELISALKDSYHVIILDSRGHGRSTMNDEPLSYHLMAKDVLGLMDFLKIKKAAIVGWSDGANIGLDIAITHPERLSKLFALAGNSNTNATMDLSNQPSFATFSQRIQDEYIAISPTPSLLNFNILKQHVLKMWETEPNFTKKNLESITVPTWIVSGDHDEAIKRSNTELMARTIPTAGLLIEPNSGHFVFLQHKDKFNDDVRHFLKDDHNQKTPR